MLIHLAMGAGLLLLARDCLGPAKDLRTRVCGLGAGLGGLIILFATL